MCRCDFVRGRPGPDRRTATCLSVDSISMASGGDAGAMRTPRSTPRPSPATVSVVHFPLLVLPISVPVFFGRERAIPERLVRGPDFLFVGFSEEFSSRGPRRLRPPTPAIDASTSRATGTAQKRSFQRATLQSTYRQSSRQRRS